MVRLRDLLSPNMVADFPFMECAVVHISSFVQQQLYE